MIDHLTKLTDDEVRVEIAKRLGWQWIPWGKNQVRMFAPKGHVPAWTGGDEETNSLTWPTSGETVDETAYRLLLMATPNYPADLNAAFTLVEKLRGEGWKFMLDNIASDWAAEFFVTARGKSSFVEAAQTPARAICLSFLAVTREEG
jgi:hypothetical protein